MAFVSYRSRRLLPQQSGLLGSPEASCRPEEGSREQELRLSSAMGVGAHGSPASFPLISRQSSWDPVSDLSPAAFRIAVMTRDRVFFGPHQVSGPLCSKTGGIYAPLPSSL